MNYRRLRIPGGCYFFTVTTQDRQPLLLEHYERLLRSISLTQLRRPFEMDGFVVLPDHLHMIWTLPPDDADFSTRWMQIKRQFSIGLEGGIVNTSKQRKRERGIWQRRFWEHHIRDAHDWRRHMDFIHYDPVKHSHCAAPRDWPFSSFRILADKGWYDETWGTICAPELEGIGAE